MAKTAPIAVAAIVIVIIAAAAAYLVTQPEAPPGEYFGIYTIIVRVVDEGGLPVPGTSIVGGDIVGVTDESGELERSMVDGEQFRQHLDATYRVEKSGYIVDQQQVRIDETINNLATITLQLARNEPVVRLDRPPGSLLFDGENLWTTNYYQNTVTKVARDGTVLGIFPVGHRPTMLAFDGENVWVAYSSYDIPDVGPFEKLPDRDRLTKLDMNGRQVGNYRIGLTDTSVLDKITDLAFDGKNIWVAHRTGGATKLALDGTELLRTTPIWMRPSDKQLIFWGDRMVILSYIRLGGTSFLDHFDLQGNHLGHYDIDIDYSIWDAAFGVDGMWLAESRGVTKIGMDGKVLLGPFRTRVVGGSQLIFDGQYIWILDPFDSSSDVVRRLSQDGQVLDNFTVGISGSGLVFDGESIWVATGEDYMWSRNYRIPTTGALWKITPD